jgi:hypothetical protein
LGLIDQVLIILFQPTQTDFTPFFCVYTAKKVVFSLEMAKYVYYDRLNNLYLDIFGVLNEQNLR